MSQKRKIKLFNSKTGKKESFEPQDPNEVKIYSCGPTVYNYPHIGNIRSFLFVDTLRRVLRLAGYKCNQTMNITDVDDKIIKEAMLQKKSITEFTQPWIEIFFEDLKHLRMQKLEHYPKATESVPEMVVLLKKLKDESLIYEKAGSTYFSIDKFPKYGALSKIDFKGVQTGTRYDTDEYEKTDIRDFVVWKQKKDPNEPAWQTEFGEGRPGWHLECSAMIRKVYQGGIDIHTGGVDLLFPHHENEIAQSEGAYPNDEFVKLWLHCEHLLVDGEKMSKSKNNFYTLRDLLNKNTTGQELRFLFLSSHYRSKLNFSLQKMEESRAGLSRLQNTIERLFDFLQETKGIANDLWETLQSGEPIPCPGEACEAWMDALLDDLNTPKALAKAFEESSRIHHLLDQDKLSQEDARRSLYFFQLFNSVWDCLDLQNKREEHPQEFLAELLFAIQERKQAKASKNFALADQIRDHWKKQGIEFVDQKNGETTWKKIL